MPAVQGNLVPHRQIVQETCSYIDYHTARCGRSTSIVADGVPRLVGALLYRSVPATRGGRALRYST